MNLLLEKYNDYMRLEGCTAQYTLSNNIKLSFTFQEENFAHLIGLHKLKDIQLIQFWLDRSNRSVKLKDVIRKIKKEELTDSIVKSSLFFPKIQFRYNSFSYDNITTLNYTDAIINFNALKINSKLNSDYILFEERPNGEYNHMGIAFDYQKETRYIETFIHEHSSKYLTGQKIVKVTKFELTDKNNQIIVKDSF